MEVMMINVSHMSEALKNQFRNPNIELEDFYTPLLIYHKTVKTSRRYGQSIPRQLTYRVKNTSCNLYK